MLDILQQWTEMYEFKKKIGEDEIILYFHLS